MRALALLAVLALAACSKGPGDPPDVAMVVIDCATDGAKAFAHDCKVEQVAQGAEHFLVVHHPSGGFRRLRKVDDGRGVVEADGGEQALVAWLPDGRLEVALGGDRYRFPAKVKPDAAPKP